MYFLQFDSALDFSEVFEAPDGSFLLRRLKSSSLWQSSRGSEQALQNFGTPEAPGAEIFNADT